MKGNPAPSPGVQRKIKTDQHTPSTKGLLPQPQPDHIWWPSMSLHSTLAEVTILSSVCEKSLSLKDSGQPPCSTWIPQKTAPSAGSHSRSPSIPSTPAQRHSNPQTLQGEELRAGQTPDEIPSPKKAVH